jgi:hypothetical protein
MRTTIRLDDALLRAAKARAAKGGRSLNEFIEDAVRMAVLASAPTTASAPPLPVLKGGKGLRRGVNLDSAAELEDLMNREPA